MVLGSHSLTVDIRLTDKGAEFDGAHYAFTTDISRSFNAFEYRSQGFIKSISATDNLFQIVKGQNMLVRKSISRTTVSYYSNPWLDTSSISLISFGETFENYQIEQVERALVPSHDSTSTRVQIQYT